MRDVLERQTDGKEVFLEIAVADVRRACGVLPRVWDDAPPDDELGGHDELKGKVAVANAKLAYQTYREVFAGGRWERLRERGATAQRCLWASTSTKNPEYRDVLYVEELIGPDTVNTMPEETIRAFQDHGHAELTLEKDVDEARALMERFEEAG